MINVSWSLNHCTRMNRSDSFCYNFFLRVIWLIDFVSERETWHKSWPLNLLWQTIRFWYFIAATASSELIRNFCFVWQDTESSIESCFIVSFLFDSVWVCFDLTAGAGAGFPLRQWIRCWIGAINSISDGSSSFMERRQSGTWIPRQRRVLRARYQVH